MLTRRSLLAAGAAAALGAGGKPLPWPRERKRVVRELAAAWAM